MNPKVLDALSFQAILIHTKDVPSRPHSDSLVVINSLPTLYDTQSFFNSKACKTYNVCDFKINRLFSYLNFFIVPCDFEEQKIYLVTVPVTEEMVSKETFVQQVHVPQHTNETYLAIIKMLVWASYQSNMIVTTI